jgi:hypothetical protein
VFTEQLVETAQVAMSKLQASTRMCSLNNAGKQRLKSWRARRNPAVSQEIPMDDRCLSLLFVPAVLPPFGGGEFCLRSATR